MESIKILYDKTKQSLVQLNKRHIEKAISIINTVLKEI